MYSLVNYTIIFYIIIYKYRLYPSYGVNDYITSVLSPTKALYTWI